MTLVKSDEIITSWVSWLKMLSAVLHTGLRSIRLPKGFNVASPPSAPAKRRLASFCAGWKRLNCWRSTQSATEEQFRHLIREVASRATGRPFVDPTIRIHLANWLESEKGTVEASTLKRYRQVARDFETFLGARGNARLEALSKAHFLEYRAALQKAGHSPQNINQTFKILCRPFKVAADERLMVHNPIGAIKRLRSVKAEKGIFTPKQISELLAAAPDAEWRALIALGYFTGGRLLDLARLTWGSVDRAKQTLCFKQKKTGGTVLIPIHPELWRYLKKLPPGVGQAPILRRLSKKSGTGKSGLSMSFRRIMEAAGIDPGIARARVGEAGRSVSKLSYHSLRHSFTSELARRRRRSRSPSTIDRSQ